MLLKNDYFVDGKIVHKRVIRDNFVILTVMTLATQQNKKNFPQIICKGAAASEAMKYEKDDYVSIEAHIGERTIYEEEKPKKIGAIYADKISAVPSLSEEFGFDMFNSGKGRNMRNEINIIGIVETISKNPKSQKKVVISLTTPKRVIMTDYSPSKKYDDITRGDIVCIKGLVQTKNITPESENPEEKKRVKHLEQYVITNFEKLDFPTSRV